LIASRRGLRRERVRRRLRHVTDDDHHDRNPRHRDLHRSIGQNGAAIDTFTVTTSGYTLLAGYTSIAPSSVTALGIGFGSWALQPRAAAWISRRTIRLAAAAPPSAVLRTRGRTACGSTMERTSAPVWRRR